MEGISWVREGRKYLVISPGYGVFPNSVSVRMNGIAWKFKFSIKAMVVLKFEC